ncbi:MAG TPA: SRPBCC family protein [Gammaproteobacteria bacterium]|nr:SRPBCC family protein [Gammaproteobacteria bacterium]
MKLRKTLLLVAIGVCYVSSSLPATLRTVDVSRDDDRYKVVADTHLDASPEAIYAVLLDFDANHYQRISEIYKESSYLPPDRDGTPVVYTRVEGCLLWYCRSMRRVERLEVVTPQFIRSRTVPERSDFKYTLSEWTFAAEGTGTRLTYMMEMEPSFWLPPFVGPWFLKRTLLQGAPKAIDQIELLAQQEERAATGAAAR